MSAIGTLGAEVTSGRQRWVMLAIIWLVFLVSCIDRVLWGSVAINVGASLNVGLTALGVFVTAFFIGYVAANIISGFICDRIGAARLIVFSLVPMGVFTALFAMTESIHWGIVLQALMGATAAADTVAGLKLITSWFDRHERGTAIGVFLTGTSLAVIIANLVVPPMMVPFGWRGVYVVFGILTSAAGLLAFATLREGPLRAISKAGSAGYSLRAMLSNPRFLLVALAGFGALWGEWGFIYWANALMIKAAGMTAQQAGFIVALFGIGALVGKPVVGFWSDQLGGVRRLPTIVLLAAFVAGLLAFGQFSTPFAFTVIAPVLGVAAFAFIPLLMALVSESVPPENVGAATGIANAFWQAGNVLVPISVGAIFEMTGSFNAAFLTLAAGPAVGIVCMLLMQEERPRQR